MDYSADIIIITIAAIILSIIICFNFFSNKCEKQWKENDTLILSNRGAHHYFENKTCFKPSNLHIDMKYLPTSFPNPIMFECVTSFFLKVKEVNFESLDFFFDHMPNLMYFGYVFVTEYPYHCYSNIFNTKLQSKLEQLEITASDSCSEFKIDYDSLIHFISIHTEHGKLRTLRIDLQMFKLISKKLIQNNVKFENLYLNWNDYLTIYYYGFCETAKYYLEKPYTKGVYKNLYLQVCTYPYNAFELTNQNFPGLKEIFYPVEIPGKFLWQSKWFKLNN